MAVYFAMRIKAKYDDPTMGKEVAQTYYNQVFAIVLYQQFQADTNAILVADGYGDVIPVTGQ